MFSLGKCFRPIDILKRAAKLSHSKVKYKYIFNKASSPLLPLSSLKLPNSPAAKVVGSNSIKDT